MFLQFLHNIIHKYIHEDARFHKKKTTLNIVQSISNKPKIVAVETTVTVTMKRKILMCQRFFVMFYPEKILNGFRNLEMIKKLSLIAVEIMKLLNLKAGNHSKPFDEDLDLSTLHDEILNVSDVADANLEDTILEALAIDCPDLNTTTKKQTKSTIYLIYVPSNNVSIEASNNDSIKANQNNNSVVCIDDSFGEISILKDGNKKFIESLNKKGSSGLGDENLTVEVSNDGNADDKYHFCIFGLQMKKKIGRHLATHKDKKAVQEFFNLPRGSSERNKIIEIIRTRGDFLHNSQERYNSGALIVSRRPNEKRQKDADSYSSCPQCGKYLNNRSAYIHIRNCKDEEDNSIKNSRTYRVMGRQVMGRIHSEASDVLRNIVFPVLREDNITKCIRYDKLIILYDNKLCTKYKPQYQHDMIRNRLRTLGRFLTEIRKINKNITDFTSVINHRSYDD
ncbi:hypothetical protein TSAR_015873 [Trichomalopsis sarcophagae]|uniref:Uncharacterized protein n=1 Tax=Trichomalopsis sarcophagae TaxID=543379 RepID=A0A232EJQ7_9HYME|nr:hypothetical protein TSAR_015873 [Trichomalopsis sarcophagae]